MKNLAIIPARGGSKRIPRKNIKNFLGKPIVAYSIEAAINSNLFDEVMVSTDDEEIASISIQYGAKIPFMRSPQTSNDYAILVDVIKEVYLQYKDTGKEFDNLCCILPTAPLVTSELITVGYNKLTQENFTIIYPIVPFSYPILRALRMNDDGSIFMHWPEYAKTRSQDLEIEYHDSGSFYWYKVQDWLDGNTRRGGIILNEMESQDIDNEVDWSIAELKYKLLKKKHSND